MQELVYLAHDDIVDCGKGVRNFKIVPLWDLFIAQNIDIRKFVFLIKTALLKLLQFL